MTQQLMAMQVNLAQIMPLVWSEVHVIDKLTGDMGIEFWLYFLLYFYEVKNVENTRYTFFLKFGRHSFVENSGANDRVWKKRYIFVDKKSIGKLTNSCTKDGISDVTVLFSLRYCRNVLLTGSNFIYSRRGVTFEY